MVAWFFQNRALCSIRRIRGLPMFRIATSPLLLPIGGVRNSPMESTRAPFKLLFVCLGNICRSPAAEIIFRKQAADAGLAGQFEIDSAGTSGHHQGAPPDSRMSTALASLGFTPGGQARRIEAEDLKNFDLIVTMDETNLSDVRQLDPTGESHRKIRPFVGFCRNHDVLRVPDP